MHEASLKAKRVGKSVAVNREHIVQQWILGDDLRLQLAIDGENDSDMSYELVIAARFSKKTESYAGGYVLRLIGSGAEREYKGAIKSCTIG